MDQIKTIKKQGDFVWNGKEVVFQENPEGKWAVLHEELPNGKEVIMEFTTHYTFDGKTYSSSVFAPDWETAEKHLEEKRKTEHVVGCVSDKKYLV